MSDSLLAMPSWLDLWIKANSVSLWGVADLTVFSTPKDETEQGFPRAIAFAMPMDSEIMHSIQNGPNQGYADEYARKNNMINVLSIELTSEIRKRGYRSQPLAASERTDKRNIKGDFPHKTVATRAGIGWIGRHCQLVTRPFGPWVRLGSVFTDMALPCATPNNEEYCGKCVKCVDACPANALKRNAWYPGISREKIIDVQACDQWKKEHYFQYHKGHNCGICSAVCPFGLKQLKKSTNPKRLSSDRENNQ